MCFTRIAATGAFGTVKRKLKAVSNCWICEGWSLVDFKFKPPHNVDEATVPVNLHLSHDDYRPELLANEAPISSLEQLFSTKRMLPPGEAQYYFTV